MPRITLYHWLPIASNMLLRLDYSGGESIEERLQNHARTKHVSVDRATGSLHYEADFGFREGTAITLIPMEGNINQRGFSQNVIDIPATSLSLGGILNANLPAFSEFVVDLLYDVLPETAKNNCAVLHEGIVSDREFSSRPFEGPTIRPAKRFLSAYKLFVIVVGSDTTPRINSGFTVDIQTTHGTDIKPDSIHIEVQSVSSGESSLKKPGDVRAFVSLERNCIFYQSWGFNYDSPKFNENQYKYAALTVLNAVLSRAIGILRDVRSHIPPLRRQLALALQHNTMLHEDFVPMIRISRYLSYVNLKLPVLQTVKNYLMLAVESSEFKKKQADFNAPEKISQIPEVDAIKDPDIRVAHVISMLMENKERLRPLFDEDRDEIQVFSDEISRHLRITLASQELQLSTRELEASETSRELDRGGKNRANALKGLSIVLAASLGIQLVEILGLASVFGRLGLTPTIVKIVAFLLTPVLAWLFIEYTIRQKSSHMRMVVDVKHRVNSVKLHQLVADKNRGRTQIEHSRRIQTWREDLEIVRSPEAGTLFESRPTGGDIKKVNAMSPRAKALTVKSGSVKWFRNRNHTAFDVSFDYEMDGFIHSITIEKEFNRLQVDEGYLVQQITQILQDAGCFDSRVIENDTSLLAKMLLDLQIDLVKGLSGLNYLLAYREQDLRGLLRNAKDGQSMGFLSEDERTAGTDLISRPKMYINWLNSVHSNDDRLTTLLGESNVSLKVRLLEDETKLTS